MGKILKCCMMKKSKGDEICLYFMEMIEMSDVIVVSEGELNGLIEYCDYVEWVRDVVRYRNWVYVGCRMRVGDYMVYGSILGDESWRLVKKVMY